MYQNSRELTIWNFLSDKTLKPIWGILSTNVTLTLTLIEANLFVVIRQFKASDFTGVETVRPVDLGHILGLGCVEQDAVSMTSWS